MSKGWWKGGLRKDEEKKKRGKKLQILTFDRLSKP